MKFSKYLALATLTLCFNSVFAQSLNDDFEGNGNIHTWFGDNCVIDTSFANPFIVANVNSSANVLSYQDNGALYANARFDAPFNFNLSNGGLFQLKIYVPSSSITGNQNNQVSLKLQDNRLTAPWSTQTEIIKPITLNQWQTVTFDFNNDPYINLNASSLPPIQRNDLNRVVIQVNGENNNDRVTAYIDDVEFIDTLTINSGLPVFNQLVWSDEFNGNGMIDTSKWFHQTQLPAGGNWFNGEIQHYTDRNVNSYQSNGTLKISARRETYTSQGHTKNFTSARLNSKFAFTNGRIDVRAKLPTGPGTWPAIWMLGQNIIESGAYWTNQGFGTISWPACGEIDIMEHWGTNQNYISSAIHTTSSSGSTINHGGRVIPNVSTAFHTYSAEWHSDRIIFSVDSVVHYTYMPSIRNASTWPFDLPQYILLNIAIQNSILSTFTSSDMEIDFVRIYQQSTVSLEEKATTPFEFSVYPNPVNDQLNISLNKAQAQSIQYRILSLEGKVVLSHQLNSQNSMIQIDNLENLKPGLYFIELTSPEGRSTERFMKQ